MTNLKLISDKLQLAYPIPTVHVCAVFYAYCQCIIGSGIIT